MQKNVSLVFIFKQITSVSLLSQQQLYSCSIVLSGDAVRRFFLKNTVIFFSLHALNLPCKFFQFFFLLCWLFLYEKLKTLCLWWAGTGTILNAGVRSRSFHQLFLLVRHAKSSSSRELLFFRVIVILLIVQHE